MPAQRPANHSLLGAHATERRLHRLWRQEGPRLPILECDDGTRLRVVYPGRPSAAAGPDFRDAILMSPEGRLLRGDVELHLSAGGWQAHGHQRDRRYNGVILHVVLWPARGPQAGSHLEMGRRVPTATLFPVLARRPPGSQELAPALPFVAGPRDRLGRLLDRAGDARFRARVRALKRLFVAPAPSRARSGKTGACAPEEVLYQGLMEALGYSKNREPFLTLAQGLPLSYLRRAAAGVSSLDRAPVLLSMLLGAAGFFESPTAPDPATASMEERWRAMGVSPVVPQGGWHLFRVRPDNHPRRRLTGMALLLDRVWDQGLLSTLTGGVRAADVAAVRGMLAVAGAPAGHGRRPAAYIGPGRAGEMAVNVLLPFCAAWGSSAGVPGLAEAAWALYRGWPPLPENEITREMSARLGTPAGADAPRPNRARRQQGLLHLYHTRLATQVDR